MSNTAQNGKGDSRRKRQVDLEKFATNWDAIFGTVFKEEIKQADENNQEGVIMNKYEIEMTELQRIYYHVVAESEEDAVKKYEEAGVDTQISMMVYSKGESYTMTGVREVAKEKGEENE